MKSHPLKLKLYSFNLKNPICEICGNPDNWNGKYLSLHLDHIDGDNRNNELSNLRILCPNCHSQTDTYAGKRRDKYKKVKVLTNKCELCDNLITNKAKKCKSCKSKIQCEEKRNFKIPSKEELIELLKNSNFVQVGKKYGISDNAVRKWCIKYEISTKSSDYK